MFHLAGLKDFSFMKKCQNVGDLRARLLVTGVGAGAGQVGGGFFIFFVNIFLFLCHVSASGLMSLRLEQFVRP